MQDWLPFHFSLSLQEKYLFRNSERRWTLSSMKSRIVKFQKCKKERKYRKIVIQTRSASHCWQTIQNCWKACRWKWSVFAQKTFQVVCSCQNPTVADFASSLCARQVKSDKDILTREGAPVKKQNNTTKFTPTDKKFKSVSWRDVKIFGASP